MDANSSVGNDFTRALKKATSRAKSDVANKLISMFLHDLSRRVCTQFGQFPSDTSYVKEVQAVFGENCPYCDRALISHALIVEHPDGMNRLRAGLHIPGNVLIACKTCNGEKRRDDSLLEMKLAPSGWESFLAHDGSKCDPSCKTCKYWSGIWPDAIQRQVALHKANERLKNFRKNYSQYFLWIDEQRLTIRNQLDTLYRECQQFAEDRIDTMVAAVIASAPIA
jgi:hypothetical protein